jgi:DNA-binding NarL/FixJ family response regulator
MSTPIRIVLVDDHDLIRESWKEIFSRDARFEVVGLCPNGANAIEIVTSNLPDIVLMDINMTPMNGFEATRRIIEALPQIKIIGTSANNNPRYADKMIQLGAKGYVTKTSTFDELKTAILAVMDGKNYICEEISSKRK